MRSPPLPSNSRAVACTGRMSGSWRVASMSRRRLKKGEAASPLLELAIWHSSDDEARWGLRPRDL
jgi:hypothetical protein